MLFPSRLAVPNFPTVCLLELPGIVLNTQIQIPEIKMRIILYKQTLSFFIIYYIKNFNRRFFPVVAPKIRISALFFSLKCFKWIKEKENYIY